MTSGDDSHDETLHEPIHDVEKLSEERDKSNEEYFSELLYGGGSGRRFDVARKIIFLRNLAKMGVVTSACRASGVTTVTVYKHRKEDDVFKAAWDDALASYADTLEQEAYRRAVVGVDEPVFYRGEKVDYVRRYSDSLLALKLKGRRPETYRERVSMEADVKSSVSARVNLGKLSDEQLTNLEQMLESGLEEDGDGEG